MSRPFVCTRICVCMDVHTYVFPNQFVYMCLSLSVNVCKSGRDREHGAMRTNFIT
jgi:hypothetical protein